MEIGIILASVGAFFGGAVSIYALLAISAVDPKPPKRRRLPERTSLALGRWTSFWSSWE